MDSIKSRPARYPRGRVENIAMFLQLSYIMLGEQGTILRKIEDKERIDFLSDGIGNRGG